MWTPTYHERNLKNIAKLAPNTRLAATKWYEGCVANKVNILIYETIRTVEQQRKNVAAGKSQTMHSYHLVGQALDFVPISTEGKEEWNAYTKQPFKSAVDKARELGFVWGADWNHNGRSDDETFIDSPHLEFHYKGYGTDKMLEEKGPQRIGMATLKVDTNVYEKPTGKSPIVKRLKKGTKWYVYATSAGFHCISTGMYIMTKDCEFTSF